MTDSAESGRPPVDQGSPLGDEPRHYAPQDDADDTDGPDILGDPGAADGGPGEQDLSFVPPAPSVPAYPQAPPDYAQAVQHYAEQQAAAQSEQPATGYPIPPEVAPFAPPQQAFVVQPPPPYEPEPVIEPVQEHTPEQSAPEQQYAPEQAFASEPPYEAPPQPYTPDEQHAPEQYASEQPDVPQSYAPQAYEQQQPYSQQTTDQQQYGQQQYAPQQYGQQQYAPQQYAAQQYDQQQYEQQRWLQQYAPEQAGSVAPAAQSALQPYIPAPLPQQQPGPPQPGPQQPIVAPVMPAPEDLLVPTESTIAAEPASWGWRGKVNRASGGLLKAKPAPTEVQAREAIKRIQRSFSRPMTVVVVQPKGGAGKTPTTVCLSAAFGAHRGGYVVGWDDNETRGTLAVRVENPDAQQSTVWDLLSDLSAFERYDARVGDLSYYVRAQPDAHFDALVSDDNPANMAQIDEDAFQRLHTVLQRFYRLIVVDTGNNVRSPNWQAAVNAADQIVAVSTYQRDVGYSASWVLDHLAQTGREDLARNAVTVLTAGDPTPDKQVREQLVSHFQSRTRAVVEIPYDTELAHGGPIRWTHMAPATRNAWISAGATVVDALAEHDLRALAARRT